MDCVLLGQILLVLLKVLDLVLLVQEVSHLFHLYLLLRKQERQYVRHHGGSEVLYLVYYLAENQRGDGREKLERGLLEKQTLCFDSGYYLLDVLLFDVLGHDDLLPRREREPAPGQLHERRN